MNKVKEVKERIERVLEQIKEIEDELYGFYQSIQDMDLKDLFERQGYRLSVIADDLRKALEWIEK